MVATTRATPDTYSTHRKHSSMYIYTENAATCYSRYTNHTLSNTYHMHSDSYLTYSNAYHTYSNPHNAFSEQFRLLHV